MNDKKVVIVGAGGIGLYFGGRLAQNGINTFFIARGETKRLLENEGLILESINGDATVKPVNVIEDVTSWGTADFILVCVKTYQIKEIIPLIKPITGNNTVVLPLQNGVEAPYILADSLGKEKVIGGLSFLSSYKIAPNHVKHVAIDPYITFGEITGPSTPRIKELKEIFDKGGIKSNISDDFLVPYWSKFVFICTLSGVGSITRMPVGTFRSLPETRTLVEQTITEIVRVAQKSGVHLNDETIQNTLKTIDNLAPHTTASMQRDIINGMPSELFEQNGTIHKLGKQLSVNTPINSFIFSSLLPQELEARKKTNNN